MIHSTATAATVGQNVSQSISLLMACDEVGHDGEKDLLNHM